MSLSRQPAKVKIQHLTGTLDLEVRALSYHELGEVILLARETGWYGNSQAQDLVIKYGLNEDSDMISALESDFFMVANAMREIWLTTLRAFRSDITKLASLSEAAHVIPPVRRYRYSDLATPAVLASIREDIQDIEDINKIKDFFFEHHIGDIRFGEKPTTPEERAAIFKEHEHRLIPWVLELLGFDKRVMSRRPLNLIEGTAERLYVAVQLVRTLDWAQFAQLLQTYNSILDELLYQSRRLGGADILRKESKLMTGMAGFLAFVSPPKKIPLEVLGAVLDDVAAREKGKPAKAPLSAHDRRIILGFMKEAKRLHPPVAAIIRNRISFARAASIFLDEMAKKINYDRRLVTRLSHVYREAYLEYVRKQQERAYQDFSAAVKTSLVPDGYLLVEGPSDKIYFDACLNVLDAGDVLLRVEDCGGKDKVVARVREMLVKRPSLGSIFAVLDGEAERQFNDLQRLEKRSRFLKSVKFRQGEIEDQIPVEIHVQALNSAHPEGDRIDIADVSPASLLSRGLAKALWDRKGSSFDKVAHARTVVRLLKAKGEEFPPTLIEITKASLELASQRSQEVPRVESQVSYDRVNRRLARLVESAEE